MVVQQSVAETRIDHLATQYENKSAQEVLEWAMEAHGSRVAVCTSFQAEGMVILDMARQIDPGVRVTTIDTGRLPQETYELMDAVRHRFGIDVEVYYPDAAELEPMVRKHGVNSFYDSVALRLNCCEIRKVKPLNRILGDLDAWITGLRRGQNSTRANVRKVEVDSAHGYILKVNPLADWSHEQVWDYIKNNDVPYNRLYDQGYTSIGCAPCTRPVRPGDDPRAGRWWWENDVAKECGIHFNNGGGI